MASLWSTLRVGTWTEREQVSIWLRRAYPFNVVIDTQRDGNQLSKSEPFTALQDALATTGKWNELTITSFPPESLASQLGFHAANPMNVLRALHVVAECVRSPSFTRLLNLVPNEAPLSELRLHSLFASTYFLEPQWIPVLQNLTVLIINGREIHEPFQLLPAFTQLQILEADCLPFPIYERDTDLPLLHTLHKLQLRASSVQWMAGREFPHLEDCAILLPRHWRAVHQHGVELPSCRKLTYHGYPTTIIQYFRAPQMRAMELTSHDCLKRRVYQQLHYLCTLDGSISKLTTLHLTLQCSEQGFMKVLKYLVPLQELALSIADPSPLWQNLLESLAAKPSTVDWPGWHQRWDDHQMWEEWCSSQIWHANVLPHLRYLGIQCPKGFSRSECLDNCPLLRLIAWTRAHLAPPLRHLNVWEGRGTSHDIVVDYTSTAYVDKHLQPSSEIYDSRIVRGMVTRSLVMYRGNAILFKLQHTTLFRHLRALDLMSHDGVELHLLPFLEQIKELKIWGGIIPAYSLNIDLPLVHTLQQFLLWYSTFDWMLGRTFTALKDVTFYHHWGRSKDFMSGHKELQVGLPACTTLKWKDISVFFLHFFSCPNLQTLQWWERSEHFTVDEAVLKSLQDFLLDCPCLQRLEVVIHHCLGLDSLVQFALCDAWEQGVWKNIGSVEFMVIFHPSNAGNPFFTQMAGHQQHYRKWWKEFTVTKEDESWGQKIFLRAAISSRQGL